MVEDLKTLTVSERERVMAEDLKTLTMRARVFFVQQTNKRKIRKREREREREWAMVV